MWGRALGNHQDGATRFTALRLCVGGRLGEGTVPLPGFRRLPSTRPVSSHFTHSLYVTGTLQLLPWWWIPKCVAFKTIQALEVKFSENLAVSSAAPAPTGFYSQKLWELIFPALESWALQSGLGLGLLAPKVSLLVFSHHTWIWDCLSPFCHHCLSTPYCTSSPLHHISMSPALLPIQMTLACLNPWWLDFHTVQFSDRSGCCLFWDLVVIPVCGCTRRRNVSAYTSILTRSPRMES